MAMTRSEQMARIRSSNTAPEQLLRAALRSEGLRFRIGTCAPGSRPDVVFAGRRVAVFIDGCFWHGCPEHYLRPRSRPDYWAVKLATYVERDRRQTAELTSLGWRVCRVWEHEVH